MIIFTLFQLFDCSVIISSQKNEVSSQNAFLFYKMVKLKKGLFYTVSVWDHNGDLNYIPIFLYFVM